MSGGRFFYAGLVETTSCRHCPHTEQAVCAIRKHLPVRSVVQLRRTDDSDPCLSNARAAFGTLSARIGSAFRRLSQAFEKKTIRRYWRTGIRPGHDWFASGEIRLPGERAVNGYEYQGTRYRSLSEIGPPDYGSAWSGPLFFGIKNGVYKPINRGGE